MKQLKMGLRTDQAVRKPAGGFCFIHAKDLVTAWMAYRRGLIELIDLRVWLACFELKARRCGLKHGQQPIYRHEEVHTLVGGVGGEHIRNSIRRLQAVGLLSWQESAVATTVDAGQFDAAYQSDVETTLELVTNHHRKVPVPRRVIRRLARTSRRVEIATVLAHLLRCLYYHKGACNAEGSCKASWVAEVFEVDERNVKAARQQLVRDGWLVPKPSTQRSLNRRGPVFEINLDWSTHQDQPRDGATISCPQHRAGSPEPSTTQSASARIAVSVANSGMNLASSADLLPGSTGTLTATATSSRLPPRSRLSTTQSPPPRENKKLSSRIFKDQKPAIPGAGAGTGLEAGDLTGFLKEGEGKKIKPDFRHVVPEDLRDPTRLDTLFEQAVTAGLVQNSECDRLRFFAAAEHARAVADRNPCGLFATVVRKQRWHFITQRDEDAARVTLINLTQGSCSPLRPQDAKPAITLPSNRCRHRSANLGRAVMTVGSSAELARSTTGITPRHIGSILEVLAMAGLTIPENDRRVASTQMWMPRLELSAPGWAFLP